MEDHLEESRVKEVSLRREEGKLRSSLAWKVPLENQDSQETWIANECNHYMYIVVHKTHKTMCDTDLNSMYEQ